VVNFWQPKNLSAFNPVQFMGHSEVMTVPAAAGLSGAVSIAMIARELLCPLFLRAL
jgi:hypothetical protein